MVVGFVFGGWDISNGFEDSTVVEPVDVFEGGELDILEMFPGSLHSDQFGLEPDDRFGQSVVERITNRPDRRFNAGLSEAFGIPNR